VVRFYEFHDTSRLLASWWKEDKKFTNRRNGWYNTVNLREPYMYLMALICRLYGEKDCSKFSEAWMPLAYTMAISEEQFQLGSHHFQTTEHQHPTGPDTKGWRNTSFPHGIVPVGRNLRKKHFRRYEFKLACC
jgi:hypothetical protein